MEGVTAAVWGEAPACAAPCGAVSSMGRPSAPLPIAQRSVPEGETPKGVSRAELRSPDPDPDPVHAPSPADLVLARLRLAGVPFGLGDRLGGCLAPGEAAALEEQAGRHAEAMLRCLLLDVDGDPLLRDAGMRLVRSLTRGLLAGRYGATPGESAPGAGA